MAGAAPFYEHFEHQADMGVRGFGRTCEEAFEQVALALTAVVVPLESVEAKQSLTVHCAAADVELLLLDWLNAVVYEMSAGKMIFCRFKVHLQGGRLEGELFGEGLEVERHQPGVEVKAATATALRVEKLPEGMWLAQLVVDV